MESEKFFVESEVYHIIVGEPGLYHFRMLNYPRYTLA